MKKNMTDHEVYMAAAQAMNEKGHCRGQFQDKYGAMCLSGAIGLVLDGNPFEGNFKRRGRFLDPIADLVGVESVWTSYTGCRDQDAIYWNNKETTTKQQVVAALDAAAIVSMQEQGIEPEDVL